MGWGWGFDGGAGESGGFLGLVGSPPWYLVAGVTPWAAYQPKGAANFAASLVDLSGNRNNAGDPGGANTPAWDAVNGWKFDGINDYLTTTFATDANQTQSLLAQWTNMTDQPYAWICGAGGTPAFALRERASLLDCYAYNQGTLVIAAGVNLAAGNFGIAGATVYQNGLAVGGVIPGGANILTPFYIGTSSGTASYKAYYCQAFALYDCALTAPQMLAIATAMAAL